MTRPLIKWALIASLGVNVAIGAAVVGALVTDGPPRSEEGARRGFGGPPEIAALAQGLDKSQRRQLFQALRADGRLKGGRERMQEIRDDIAATLRTEPFDPAAFQTAMNRQRTLQGTIADTGIDVLSGLIADLSASERAHLADRVAESRRRR